MISYRYSNILLLISEQFTSVPVREGNYTVEIGRSRFLLCNTNTTVVGSFSPVWTYWSSSRSNCTFIPFSKYCCNRERSLIVVLRLSASVKTECSQKKCWLFFFVTIDKYPGGSTIFLCQ